MTFEVSFHPLARDDLFGLYDYIAQASGLTQAGRYIDRIEQACLGLSAFPERGKRRDDLVPGLRTIALERRVLIAFTVDATAVTILRILYAGRDFGSDDLPA